MSGGRRSRAKRSSNKRSFSRPKSARDGRLRSRTETTAEEGASQQTAPAHDGLMCDCCSRIIANTDDHVIIAPCNHQLCTLCMIRSHASRGPMSHSCPVASCNRTTSGCRFMSSRSERETLTNSTAADMPDVFLQTNSPTEYLIKKHRQDLIDDPNGRAVVLFGAQITNDDGLLRIHTIPSSTLFISKDDTIKDEDSALELIGQFGDFLHPIIIPLSKPKEKLRHRPVLSPRELLEFRAQNMRCIDVLLYGLATGNHQIDEKKILGRDYQDYQSSFLAAAVVASDVIMRDRVDQPLEFQLTMKEVFHRQKLTGECQQLLTAFRSAPSKSYQMRARHEEVMARIEKGVEVSPRDLVIILFDNIGFRVLGRQASYDQWIVVNIVVIKEEDLKKVGFYMHDDDPEKQISRTKNVNWEDKIKAATTDDLKKALADEIIGIKSDDNNMLAECTLSDIQVVIDHYEHLSEENDFGKGYVMPRIDLIINSRTREAMEERKENKGRDHTNAVVGSTQHVDFMPRDHAPTNVTNEIGGRVLAHRVGDEEDEEEEEEGEEEGSEEEEEDDDDEEGSGDNDEEAEEDVDAAVDTDAAATGGSQQNRYQRNHNTKLQMEHRDLNKTESVERLIHYGATSQKAQLDEWEKVKHKYASTAEPPVAATMNALGTDGQPATQASKLIRDDGGRTLPTSTFVSFGGLHTVMKTLNANGEFFEALLRGVVAAIRDTLDKQNWFLFVSDPRQREEEYPIIVLAHYLVAYEELRKVLERDVTAEEVLDHMLERGEKYATCAFALLELRMGAIAKLMRNSERIGNSEGVKLFFATLRFALRLFTVTHKTDYVCLGCDLLLWYHCASDAQRKIYDNYIFTQTTSNGVSVFHDYFVELSVMNLRQFSGKIFYQGLGADLEYLAATIPEKDGQSINAQTLRDKDAKTRKSNRYGIKMNDYLGKLVEKIREMKLWKSGVAPVVRGEKGQETITCKSDVITLPGGVNLPSSTLLSIMDIGDKRLTEYFVCWYIDNYGATERTEKFLTKMKTSKKELRAELDMKITLATSVETTDFEPQKLTRGLIWKEIESMRARDEKRPKSNRSKEKQSAGKLSAGSRKKDLVNHLVHWRKKEFKAHTRLKGTLLQAINDEYDKANVMKESTRKKLLESEFFSFSQYREENESHS